MDKLKSYITILAIVLAVVFGLELTRAKAEVPTQSIDPYESFWVTVIRDNKPVWVYLHNALPSPTPTPVVLKTPTRTPLPTVQRLNNPCEDK